MIGKLLLDFHTEKKVIQWQEVLEFTPEECLENMYQFKFINISRSYQRTAKDILILGGEYLSCYQDASIPTLQQWDLIVIILNSICILLSYNLYIPEGYSIRS